MRLVICDGIQYDADNLPPNVDAGRCMPADQWFAENRTTTAKDAPKPAPAKADTAQPEAEHPARKGRRAAKS